MDDLKKTLKIKKADAILISSVANITYLTGYLNFVAEEREAYLLILSNKQFIITNSLYTEAVTKEISNFELLEYTQNLPLQKIFKEVFKKNKVNYLLVEENNLTLAEYKFIKPLIKKIANFDLKHRILKSPGEIIKIDNACKIADLAFEYIQTKLKTGVSEKEIAFLLESFFIKNNSTKSFNPIVAFGENSSKPHHQFSDKKLTIKRGQFILLDFGVKYKNYCSDMTRTIFWGKPSKKQVNIYKAVLESQRQAINYITNNKNPSAKLADKIAREYIISKGYPSIPHSLGHGIGIEVHEPPRLSHKSKATLKSGMVFSIEPGIYIPDFGGVRIEDLFTIENGGLRQLTNSSKEIIIL